MKFTIIVLLLSIVTTGFCQPKAEKRVREILAIQAEAWSKGDIEGFMNYYLKSDSLLFIGSNGVKWGWQQTIDNYKKSYPDATAMGTLKFDLIQVKKLSSKYYFVVGKWMLQRKAGDLSGHFNVLFHKIKGRWYIVADHSS